MEGRFEQAIDKAEKRLAHVKVLLPKAKTEEGYKVLVRLQRALEDALVELTAGRVPKSGMGL